MFPFALAIFRNKTDFKTVARISLTLDEPWETLEDMETSDYDITVIPYN